MELKERIRDLMKERGWTEYRLAKEANLSHSTISNMFKRSNSPTVPTLQAICEAFHITLSQFFETEESGIMLDAEQKELWNKWIRLSEEQKQTFLNLLDMVLKTTN